MKRTVVGVAVCSETDRIMRVGEDLAVDSLGQQFMVLALTQVHTVAKLLDVHVLLKPEFELTVGCYVSADNEKDRVGKVAQAMSATRVLVDFDGIKVLSVTSELSVVVASTDRITYPDIPTVPTGLLMEMATGRFPMEVDIELDDETMVVDNMELTDDEGIAFQDRIKLDLVAQALNVGKLCLMAGTYKGEKVSVVCLEQDVQGQTSVIPVAMMLTDRMSLEVKPTKTDARA